jgi:hypothetical protein
MKKILCGLIQTTLSPFIIILGYYMLSSFSVPDGTMSFASIMGGFSIIFNFIMGCLLIVRGYQDSGTFKGW